MSNLYGVGLSGLRAAQTGLATAGNNISNVNTPGYSRQRTVLTTSEGGGSGNGVRVSGVERQYAQYLSGQLNGARSDKAGLDAHLGQATQINNLLGDSDAGISTLMQRFFSGMQTLAADPADSAAREAVLGESQSMAGQFRSFARYLDNMGTGAESQMSDAVDQINNQAKQIFELNRQIVETRAKTGSEPNNLLDQRDQLVSGMSELVSVDVSVQDGDSYQIAVAGRTLVDANGTYSLEMTQSAADPSRKAIAHRASGGRLQEIPEDRINGGTLGGLVDFRNDTLEPAERRLGQMAHVLSQRVNEVHRGGTDLRGNDGQAFFTESAPTAFSNGRNLGDAEIDVSFVEGGASDVRPSDYEVRFDNGQYRVTRLSDGQRSMHAADEMPLTVDGLSIDIEGTPSDGDSFKIKPLADAARGFDVAISETGQIAASQGNGPGDNSNALALGDLQRDRSINGDTSFNEAYAGLVSDVGNKTRALRVNGEAQAQLTSELETAQQAVSGVNLDEERINLLYYQQMYQANARVIDTASTLFDTLLGLRR